VPAATASVAIGNTRGRPRARPAATRPAMATIKTTQPLAPARPVCLKTSSRTAPTAASCTPARAAATAMSRARCSLAPRWNQGYISSPGPVPGTGDVWEVATVNEPAAERADAAATPPGRRTETPGQWVLLSYRVPREPSTPRIAVWRKLKRLGVAQISDGLVALPADARTREQLEWVAEEVTEAGGAAGIWLAQPGTLAQERELAAAMAAARAEEYRKVAEEAAALETEPPAERERAVRRLRVELRRIARRDFFAPHERDDAHAAVERLAPGFASLSASRRASQARPPAAARPGRSSKASVMSTPEVPGS
jgi:hypothetical protein